MTMNSHFLLFLVSALVLENHVVVSFIWIFDEAQREEFQELENKVEEVTIKGKGVFDISLLNIGEDLDDEVDKDWHRYEIENSDKNEENETEDKNIECDMKKLFDCRRRTDQILDNEELLLTDESLGKFCGEIKIAFECAENYIKACDDDPHELQKFQKYTSDIREITEHLCNEEFPSRKDQEVEGSGRPDEDDDLQCDITNLYTCHTMQSGLTSVNGTIYFSDTFLKEHCGPIKESYDCVAKYYEACDELELQKFRNNTSQITDVLKELCNEESKLRQDYNNYVECLRTSQHYYKCPSFAKINLDSHLLSNNRIRQTAPGERDYHMYDCLYADFLEGCVVITAFIPCHSKATGALQNILERTAAPLREEFCPLERMEYWSLAEYVDSDENL